MAHEVVLNRKTYGEGASVFREGDQGDVAYVVQTGRIEIFKIVDGVEKVLGDVGPGGIFGEMALIDDKPRMASARVVDPSTVIVVSRQMLEDKLKKSDPFVRGLLHILASTIRRMSQQK
ncbi:MAG: cyclic nucleotide-binding domain-containing protein [Magnetospirillum sp. WYHS-4]